MSFFKRLVIAFTVGIVACFGSVQAQCLNPAWDISDAPFALNDIVSDVDGNDYICINASQGHWQPSGGAGHFGWSLYSSPCAATTAPEVDSTQIRGTYCRTAFGIGTIADDGGETITSRGFVYGSTPNPTLEDDYVLVDDGTTVGDEFEGLLEDLTPETTYYVRTYATNSIGTTYGLEAYFTTYADEDCADCNLACDQTDASLLNPATWPGIIDVDDTLCVTQDVTIYDNVKVRGMIKLCNDANVTLFGSIDVENEQSDASFKGQIVYEGCDEKFIGTGSYTGEVMPDDASVNDPRQMISYCGICNSADTSQFLDVDLTIAFWTAGCRPTTSFLPVELIQFQVEKTAEGTLVKWATASEINNSHFEIELSYDGIHYTTIGIVQGAGNSTFENRYQFLDNEKTTGTKYYRLKQVDYDETYTYSNVRYINYSNNEDPERMIAYQNAANQLSVEAAVNGTGTLEIYDTRGRILQRQTFLSATQTGLKITFDTKDFSNGVYFVVIRSSNFYQSKKVQVNR